MKSIEKYVKIVNEYKQSVAGHYANRQISDEYVRHFIDGAIKLIDAMSLVDLLDELPPPFTSNKYFGNWQFSEFPLGGRLKTQRLVVLS